MATIKFSQLQELLNPSGDTIFPVVNGGHNYKLTLNAIRTSVSASIPTDISQLTDTQGLISQGSVGPQGPQGAAGPKGDVGDRGLPGADGAAGPGVPMGGTAGQVLAKIDNNDFNTEWINVVSNGGISTATVTSLIASSLTNYATQTYVNSKGSLVQSATAPTGTTTTLWYDTVGGRSYVYYDSNWVDSNPMPTVDSTQLVNNGYSLGLDSAGVVNLPTFAGSPSIAIVQTASAGIDLNVNGTHYTFNTSGTLSLPNDFEIKSTPGTVTLKPVGLDNRAYVKISYDSMMPDQAETEIRSSGNVGITTIDTIHSNTIHNWYFRNDGTISFPDGSLQTTAYTGTSVTTSTGNFIFVTNDVSLPAGNNMTLSTYQSGGNKESKLTLSTSGISSLDVGNNLRVRIGNGTGFEKTWTFGADGSITWPDTSVQSAAHPNNLTNGSYSVSLGSNGRITLPISDQSVSSIESASSIWLSANGKLLQLNSGGAVDFPLVGGSTALLRTTGNLTLNANGKEWLFGSNGSVQFPDNTVQTTAFTTSSYINISDLKTLVAASTSFTDFQARIAAL